jgi:hypothetical protein
MTKLRAADTIEDAVSQAIALLGTGPISLALSSPTHGQTVSESLIRKWSDPEMPHRIGLHHALAIEMQLVKTGNTPVFGDLFNRLVPRDPEGAPARLVSEAMHTTADAASFMTQLGEALDDGELDAAEKQALRSAVEKVQKRLAVLKRGLVSA